MSLRDRGGLWFGVAFLLLGLVVGVASYALSGASFAEASGTITQASLASADYGPGPRILSYTYIADGREYSGQGSILYSARQDDALQPGHSIRVFYDRAHPLASYPLSPPSRVWWIGSAIFLVAFGCVAILWSWAR
jgi:hypothetical protein